MAPIHRLGVGVGIPIGIKNDACVRTRKVDTQPTCTGGQHKDEVPVVLVVARPVLPGRLLGIENVHGLLAVVDVSGTIDPAVPPAPKVQVVLNDVEDLGHLTENENLVAV